MATQEITLLVDDTDGTDADETVEFALDGARYVIDLSADNADRLRGELREFVNAARRTGGRRKRGAGSRHGERHEELRQIREWARAQGIPVAARGRIAQNLIDRYRESTTVVGSASTRRRQRRSP